MTREELKRHCEATCKMFSHGRTTTRTYMEHRLVLDLLEQTTWTHVSDGLPEDGRSVLFCDIDGDIMIGYHVKGRLDTHFTQDGTYEDIKNVVAWMPLPSTYNIESEEINDKRRKRTMYL